ncbi:hypothetical protein GBA65_18515 [Rubrobacter marinus]|uniref:Uncharacterized protein n=1 Tax=Rubrobacter marinus TaxID=2653852 RepID=A0A6G8Q110_9ACTN|nr:hypothetical protein [Rubrobacter marinus]QIN80179.1 hypothetical protein GBA65_18515 [Rubrobacter marinus]
MLDEFTGSGNQQTETFDITGESFRVTFDVTSSTDNNEDAFLGIIVNDENEDPITTISQSGAGSDSSIVNEAPGTFFLDVVASSADYTITVEDCTSAANGNNGDDGDDNGGNVSDDDNDVDDDTIPDKDLPDTGGAGAGVLGGAGLIVLFAVFLVRISKFQSP